MPVTPNETTAFDRVARVVRALGVMGLAGAACTSGLAPLSPLPIAALACPERAVAGTPFVVDGSASTGRFASTQLSVGDPLPHGDPVDVTGSFALVAYDRPRLANDPSGTASANHTDTLDPSPQCADAPVLALVSFVQQQRHVSMTLRYCAIAMPNVQTASNGVTALQSTSWSAAAVDALPALGPVVFDLERAEAGALFAPPLDDVAGLGVANVVGARLADDNAALLPADWNDAELSDDDGDGWPAVTVNSSAGVEDIVYRRFLRAMSGTIVSSDEIDGSNEGSWRADADVGIVSFVDFMVPVGTGEPSTFHMSRVDPAATCDDVRGDLEALLASFPAPATPADCPAF